MRDFGFWATITGETRWRWWRTKRWFRRRILRQRPVVARYHYNLSDLVEETGSELFIHSVADWTTKINRLDTPMTKERPID